MEHSILLLGFFVLEAEKLAAHELKQLVSVFRGLSFRRPTRQLIYEQVLLGVRPQPIDQPVHKVSGFSTFVPLDP